MSSQSETHPDGPRATLFIVPRGFMLRLRAAMIVEYYRTTRRVLWATIVPTVLGLGAILVMLAAPQQLTSTSWTLCVILVLLLIAALFVRPLQLYLQLTNASPFAAPVGSKYRGLFYNTYCKIYYPDDTVQRFEYEAFSDLQRLGQVVFLHIPARNEQLTLPAALLPGENELWMKSRLHLSSRT